MNIPSIKDLIKDNFVHLMAFKSGNLFYILEYLDKTKPDQHSAHCIYQFPVPISDVGEAEMKNEDKAIYFMRWIKRAIEDGTFIQV